MTNFTKLSLIAALSLAGTTASAQPLAEAIKNVEVSGTVVYRYNDVNFKEGTDITAGDSNSNYSKTSNNYKIAVNLNSKVTDDVTFNSRFIIGDGTDMAGLDTQADADANLAVQLSEANFAYTGIANTAIIVGKQAMPTSFTVDRDSTGGENVGTGILAQTSFGPATLYAAYFNQNNFNAVNDTGLAFVGSENVLVAGTKLAFGPVNVDASYVDVKDIFDAYTLGVDAGFDLGAANLEAFARYTSLDLEDDISKADNNLWKVGVAASTGIFGAHLSYGKTDRDGGTVGIMAGADTGFDEHWMVTLSGQADADALYAGVDAQVTDKINLALNYSTMDAGSRNADGERDEVEYYGQVTYDHSSNLSTLVRFGKLDVDKKNADDYEATAGRIQVKYSF